MTAETYRINLSELDEQRFGIRFAKAVGVKAEHLEAIDKFCIQNEVKLLTARCLTTDLSAAQAMERDGFQLMDTLVYYIFEFGKKAVPESSDPATIRPVHPDETEQVRRVAKGAFHNYSGHYHADPRLDQATCDSLYVDWAARSVESRSVADEVLIAELDGNLVGFGTLKLITPQEGDGVLFAVAPEAQGRGIFRSLLIHSLKWCAEKGCERMLYSTQITNTAPQKVLVRCGFEMHHSYYTFHKWFD